MSISARGSETGGNAAIVRPVLGALRELPQRGLERARGVRGRRRATPNLSAQRVSGRCRYGLRIGVGSARLGSSRSAGQRRELYRIGALLSQYMAQSIGDLGRRREGARWWRTARYAANCSGDPYTIMFVRGRKAIRAIFDGLDPETIINEIGRCDPLIADGPAAGRPSLLAARAQSFALLGRREEAESSLTDLRETFAALPSSMTKDHSWHCWAYPEERVRFAESFVYSHLGDTFRQPATSLRFRSAA